MKLFNIKHRVQGYRLDAETALNMAGSLRYRWMKHSCFNPHSFGRKRTLYALLAHKIHLLIIKYNVENDA